MNDYTAWINDTSVARGTLSHVKAKAREIFNTPRWQAMEYHSEAKLRITRGARQLFVSSEILKAAK